MFGVRWSHTLLCYKTMFNNYSIDYEQSNAPPSTLFWISQILYNNKNLFPNRILFSCCWKQFIVVVVYCWKQLLYISKQLLPTNVLEYPKAKLP